MSSEKIENKIYFEEVKDPEVDQHFPSSQKTSFKYHTSIEFPDLLTFEKDEIPENFKKLFGELFNEGMEFRDFLSQKISKNKDHIRKMIIEKIEQTIDNEILQGKILNIPNDIREPDFDFNNSLIDTRISLNKNSLSANESINLDFHLFHQKHIFPWEVIAYRKNQIAESFADKVMKRIEELKN